MANINDDLSQHIVTTGTGNQLIFGKSLCWTSQEEGSGTGWDTCSEEVTTVLPNKHCSGGQRKRFKDRRKVSLNKFSIDSGTWEDAATDRPEWRSLIVEGAVSYEERRLTGAEDNRIQRKSFSINSSLSYLCADSGRTFRAAIGLFSHKRTHRGSVDLLDNM